MSSEHIKRSNQAGWDDMADSYQAETVISLDDVHYGPLSPGERELGLLGDVRGRRVLELACGAAQNSIALTKQGAAVTAMDISNKQLRHARRLAASEGVGVDLLRGDMESLAMFKDGIFDLVLSSFGWEYVPDLGRCLEECARVIAVGGTLVVCTVHPLAAFEWDEDSRDLRVFDYFRLPVEVWPEPEQGRDGGATFFHTVEDVFGLLTDSGFAVERVLEPSPYPIPEMSESELSTVPYRGPTWERQYERMSRVPFTIIYTARKSSS
jgi:ubiquinone/menaquinone biosynthesis C-methylase UbiE